MLARFGTRLAYAIPGELTVLNRAVVYLGILVSLAAAPAWLRDAGAQETSNSAARGPAATQDLPAKDSADPSLKEVMDAAGHDRVAINIVWTLMAGFLVMFMQAGFAMVETGFTRAKNVAHTMSMNLMIYGIGMLGYWICGYAFQMGGMGAVPSLGAPGLNHELSVNIAGKSFGLLGLKGFFLNGSSYPAGIFALFLFQMVFMDTAATIPTGAMAERWKFSSFVTYGFFMGMIVYPIFANWVWGGGWLSRLGVNFGIGHGHVDHAGSSVVHMVGGVAALAGARALGPRLGKFTRNGKPLAIPGHDIPMAVIGTFILAFGWFGFNAGSTLAGTDLRISVIAVNTMLASAAGAFSAMLLVWLRYGKPEPSILANGMLAGLVAITASCAFVNSVSAVLIGTIAGLLVVASVFFVERTLKVDDPVGAISVHGTCGTWGTIALGLFADGSYGNGVNGVPGTVRGLFYGDLSQLLAQAIGVLTCFVFVFASFYVFFKVLDRLIGNRVSVDVEFEGLDMSEMGAVGYPDFMITPAITHGVAPAPPPRFRAAG